MANYANLLATIAANIYTNGNQEVTAAMVKSAMDAMVGSLGAGYQFMGVAHPSDTPSDYADLRAFWLAGEAGTYNNFGGLVLNDGEVAVIKYDSNGWSKDVTGAASAAQVSDLDNKIDGYQLTIGRTAMPYHFEVGHTYLIINTEAQNIYVYGRVSEYSANVTIKSPLASLATFEYTPDTELFYVMITGGTDEPTTGIKIYDKTTFSALFDYEVSDTQVITNEIPVAAYNYYDQNDMIWDSQQQLPVGAKITKIRCASTGSNAPKTTKMVVWDENNTQISRFEVGTIGTGEIEFDVSNANIVVRAGYKYGAECVAYKSTQGISGRYKRYSSGTEIAMDNMLFGFAFVCEAQINLAEQVEELKEKVDKCTILFPVEKKILWLGDSIGEASSAGEGPSGTQRYGWSGRIADYFGGTFYSLARSGYTITKNVAAGVGSIITKLEELYNNGHTGQYLIMEGGTNDADRIGSILNGNVPAKFGTWSKDDFSGNYDEETFCGAVDSLFYKALTHYKGVKLGFIIAQKMGLSGGAYTENRRAYFDVIIEMCKKWGVPFIDLWDKSFLNPNLTNQYDPSKSAAENISAGSYYTDGQHLTALAYDYLAEPISSWLETL